MPSIDLKFALMEVVGGKSICECASVFGYVTQEQEELEHM
jgi:hypothetical protein